MDYSPPGSSIHGISQARILEWVAISFSRGSSWPVVWAGVSCVFRLMLNLWATWGSLLYSVIDSSDSCSKCLLLILKLQRILSHLVFRALLGKLPSPFYRCEPVRLRYLPSVKQLVRRMERFEFRSTGTGICVLSHNAVVCQRFKSVRFDFGVRTVGDGVYKLITWKCFMRVPMKGFLANFINVLSYDFYWMCICQLVFFIFHQIYSIFKYCSKREVVSLGRWKKQSRLS